MDIIRVSIEWAKAEVFSAKMVTLLSVLFFLVSLGFWQFGKTAMAKAFVWPLLITGVLMIVVAGGLYFANTYRATMHFNGQSTVLQLNADTATGIAYCIAHHQTITDGVQKLMIANIRYHDSFVKQDGKWLFSERRLMVDWIENR